MSVSTAFLAGECGTSIVTTWGRLTKAGAATCHRTKPRIGGLTIRGKSVTILISQIIACGSVDNQSEFLATTPQYGIRSIPTLLLFKDGQVIEQIVGAVPKRVIVDKLSRHLS
jgi:thiol-disulfide isomerase/thioredoxin